MQQDAEDIVTRNLGIVVKISVSFWKVLPPSTKSWWEIEDLIQEAILEVIRKADRYRGRRGRESTFVQTIVINYCKDLLDRFNAKKRTGTCIELEDVFCSHDVPLERLLHAKGAIEQLLSSASDDLRHSVSALLEGNPEPDWPDYQVSELLRLAHQYAISADDFRIICYRRPN